MASVKYFTRTKLAKFAPVYLRFVDGRSIDIFIKTPFRIIPGCWNAKKQRFNKGLFSKEFTEKDALDVEKRLGELRDFILREHFKLTAVPDKDWLSGVINAYYYKDKRKPETLTEYMERYLKEAASGERLTVQRRVYSPSTIKSMRSMQTEFVNFQKDKKKKLEWNDINIDVYNDWLAYFNKKKYSPNTVGKHLKSFKTIIRQARDEGLHNSMEVERRAFKVISSKVENIYLTEAELNSMLNLKLGGVAELVRNIFLVGCYTAQRFSDFSRIRKDNIKVRNGSKAIELIQVKTGEKCIIPVRPELDDILKKYNYTLPKTYDQLINKHIKTIARMAGITEPVQVEEFRSGLKISTTVPKCLLVKTHSARRTGCTLMYLARIPVIDIMKISGHKTEREFLKYICVSKEETAANLAKHPYFIGKPLKIV